MPRKIYNFEGPDSLSVGEYLNFLNKNLEEQRSRIKGEVCNLKLYDGRSYMYFSIKDKEVEATLNCFMWKRDYTLSGVELADGIEVIIEGYPKVYVPNGSLSFQTEMVELVGEGALKIAYEKLKLKLESEGALALERKRPTPEYSQRIGVITSRDGAVLSDFRSNIGHFGFELQFVNSKVEGQSAIKDLVSAVQTLKKKDIEVLVIMRGGGSLESFAAFNNEILVREIINFPVPVVVGIGHDKDVCLVALVADTMVSTPTAVAEHLNKSWVQALSKVQLYDRELIARFTNALSKKKLLLERHTSKIRESFGRIFESFTQVENRFYHGVQRIEYLFKEMNARLVHYSSEIIHHFTKFVTFANHFLNLKHKELGLLDPERQLKLGYSIVRHKGKIITSVSMVKVGENVNIKTFNGELETEIRAINQKSLW